MDLMQTSFNGGEWSPLLEGRTDLDKYGNACHQLENFLLDPRGPAFFRPGFRYITGTKTNGSRSRLIPFEFSVTQAYILEFGDRYIRFFMSQAPILSGGVSYEIASPYAAADLDQIKFCQSADVLYLFHPSYAPRKLSRTGHTAWVLSTINFRPPAISEEGIKPAATLTLGATTGDSVTFTASAGVFLSGDIGRVITSGVGRASITSFSSSTVVTCEIIDDFSSAGPIASQSWSLLGSPRGTLDPSAKSPVGAIVTLQSSTGTEVVTSLNDALIDCWVLSASGTNEYYLINTAPGYTASKPSKVYMAGVEALEGVLGSIGIVQWAWGNNDTLGYNTIYVRTRTEADPDTITMTRATVTAASDFFRAADVGKYIRIHSGLVKITGYVSATEIRGEIIKELSADTATADWTLDSDTWNLTNGYPSCGVFYEERLILAGSTAYPETIWGSVVGDYENFTPGVGDSDAFEFSLSGRQVNVIRWLEPREYLIVGTVGGEWRLGPEDTGKALTPLNVVAKQEGNYGSADVTPMTVAGSTLFVQRANRKLREFTYQWQEDGYLAPDLTLLAEHVTSGSLAGIVYQQEPFSMLWGWGSDGSLVCLSYLRDQSVVGWHRHPTSGYIESMAVIPGTGYDEVWAIVRRTVNGSTVRYIEMLEKIFTDTAATYTTNKGLNAFFVDAGKTYNGTATTTITGAGHLERETVAILADGDVVDNQTVINGQFTIPKAASVVHYGLPYTGLFQSMRLNAGLNSGTMQGKTKKINEVKVRVYNSGVFKLGRDENHLDNAFDIERVLTFDAPYPLFTGDVPVQYDGAWEQDGKITIVQDKPMPLTMVATISNVSVT